MRTLELVTLLGLIEATVIGAQLAHVALLGHLQHDHLLLLLREIAKRRERAEPV
jgi:hypothetical protein